MTAYYNEVDPKAAAWLRDLIKADLIAPGFVDERSIIDVNPYELTGYNQHHFFAGIGGWSYALRLAGWPDDKPVVTGSCPCQPFSAAGKQLGTKDERHLWPVFYNIITFLSAPIVFGEQVASKAAEEWLDGVFADLEGAGYACGASDLCAASVGADHIRQRFFWVAESTGAKRTRRTSIKSSGGAQAFGKRAPDQSGRRGMSSWLANTNGGQCRNGELQPCGQHGQQQKDGCAGRGLADVRSAGLEERQEQSSRDELTSAKRSGDVGRLEHAASHGRLQRWTESERRRTGRGCWDVFETIQCADGKARRFEPGAQCLVDGLSPELANRWNASLGEIKEKITAYATSTKTRPAQVLRTMRSDIQPQFLQWCAGGSISLQASAVLYTALCELSGELGEIVGGEASGITEASWHDVREVRINEEPTRASSGRGLSEQLTEELRDTMRELSPEVAPMILHSYPLAHGISGRVGLLRGYGNAIVPEVAAQFIQAANEAIS